MRSAARRTFAALVHLGFVSSVPACGETQETTGTLSARQVTVQGQGAITLVNGQITLVDAQGRRAIVTASGIQFYDAAGRALERLVPASGQQPP